MRNDNSSRFGKFIEIYFDEDGGIEGARIDQYLLEKSRIVAQNKYERNYHIFYCMLAGLSKEDKQKFELQDPNHYKYLTGVRRKCLYTVEGIKTHLLFQGGSTVCEGRDDAAEFSDIKSAMKVLMMTDQEIWDILKVLAALLHMGNIKYKGKVIDNLDATDIPDHSNVERVATILGVQKSSLVDALTSKTIFAQGESVVSTLNTNQSKDIRDAFAKGIYGRLFVFIVKKINAAIYKPDIKFNDKCAIGVLDIFGFENFDTNSFEQFCINFANENLQQFFVQHIFKMEQEEYNHEAINWQHIEFVDNQEALDLIAVRPLNIMALVDEESKFPKVIRVTNGVGDCLDAGILAPS